jgi:hypothetical protein
MRRRGSGRWIEARLWGLNVFRRCGMAPDTPRKTLIQSVDLASTVYWRRHAWNTKPPSGPPHSPHHPPRIWPRLSRAGSTQLRHDPQPTSSKRSASRPRLMARGLSSEKNGRITPSGVYPWDDRNDTVLFRTCTEYQLTALCLPHADCSPRTIVNLPGLTTPSFSQWATRACV